MAEDMTSLAEAAAGGRRSKLHLWMHKNHRRFAREVLEAAGRPNWEALAAEFARKGLRPDDGRNKAPGEAVRKTWMGVRQRLEREAGAKVQPARVAPLPLYGADPILAADDVLPDEFADIERALGR